MPATMLMSDIPLSSQQALPNQKSFMKQGTELYFKISLLVPTAPLSPPQSLHGIHAAAKSNGTIAIRKHLLTPDGQTGTPTNHMTVCPMTPRLRALVDANWETAPEFLLERPKQRT